MDKVILILSMAFVTYLPRALPVVLIDKMKSSPKFERFLQLIHYTAMAALIFPGVFTADSGCWYIGAVGGGVAALLGWKKRPVTVCVLAAIAADAMLQVTLK